MIKTKFSIAWLWFLVVVNTEPSFDYDNPNSWPLNFTRCGGKRQSPIAIDSKTVQPINLPRLKFKHYDEPISGPVKLLNNGHTAMIGVGNTSTGSRPSVWGGGLAGLYEVGNIHFHWGSPTSKGAEHVIDNIQQDMELHIPHKNTKYRTFEEALANKDGLIVLAILFSETTNKTVENFGRQTVYDALPNISMFNSESELDNTITMQSILGNLDTSQFYRYNGSLTTPPCAEAVTWFVFQQVLEIESEDLQKFFGLRDHRGKLLLDNRRPIQPTGKRKLYQRKFLDD